MVNISKFVPWKTIVRRTAKKHGFLDPITLMGKMRNFSQPSEVSEPIELIRAGAYFHARGLINARTIQNNMDWIWPYWVEKQFDPTSESFIPRAFSITHINMTHRNWTAVGIPGYDAYPVVDPRGLVTPFWDGWSLDAWIVGDGGELIQSKMDDCRQELILGENSYAVSTDFNENGFRLNSDIRVEIENEQPVLKMTYTAEADMDANFILALRPYNPEGISFIDEIRYDADRWTVADRHIRFDEEPDSHHMSNYAQGDVYRKLNSTGAESDIQCKAGLANAAASYALKAGESREFTFNVNLLEETEAQSMVNPGSDRHRWAKQLEGTAKLDIPDKRMQHIYDAAVRSLILMSPDWTYPGPYTYKRFWYRDAALIINGLLDANMIDTAEQILDRFPEKQTLTGFYHSQEGEWDSNGEVIWAYHRYSELTGRKPKDQWLGSIERGARWIDRKRLSADSEELHAGLMPSGFSAEHLGNIDFYYWDNFWSVAGLDCAAELIEKYGDGDAERFREASDELSQHIVQSLERSESVRDYNAIPASPHRRMDSGAVGSIVAGYPLKLYSPDHDELKGTLEFLIDESYVNGAFYQNMIHSGLNAYLTLHVAQNLLRMGDRRFADMVRTTADIASPTCQWPEAVHPRTGGGCMGDGHHVWASAEWVAMIRNMFIREEGDKLIIGSGVLPEWLDSDESISFGPTPTPWGNVIVTIDGTGKQPEVRIDGQWRGEPAETIIALPGYENVSLGNVTAEPTISIESE